ncbi:MAG TPA: hypothetical protein VK819_12310 [Acidobacteriaceae bacterium]|nr:hypothetical protein [Acidobacteriaceae bacterium]
MRELLRIAAPRRWALACLASLILPAVAMAHTSQQAAAPSTLPDAPAIAQSADSSSSVVAVDPQTQSSSTQAQPQSSSAQAQPQDGSLEGKQTKRILFVIPNFRSVSADQHLPPQSAMEKFKESTQDSFDYSSVIFAGALAGIAQAEGSTREFHQGAAGYGRYFWHTFADQADENYQVEFIFPVIFRQDPRFYTLGHGGFVKRAIYSFDRVLITRTDSGNESFNASEIIGAGAAAGISDLYYPSQERTWTKTGQRWLLNVSLDGGTFIFKEFWPDINNKFFHQKD